MKAFIVHIEASSTHCRVGTSNEHIQLDVLGSACLEALSLEKGRGACPSCMRMLVGPVGRGSHSDQVYGYCIVGIVRVGFFLSSMNGIKKGGHV